VRNVITTAAEFTSGKVIALLGCGGDRDSSKRPLMGSALIQEAGVAVFTSDNPRSEDPKEILEDMTKQLQISEPSRVIVDRREAIAYAVSICKPGDTLLVLGKGHENGQEINGAKIEFDDRLVLGEILKELR
jgi:UDP-N-acetylmuramoyl-L-alanyl-D-glutamate--2,6-diaminopimelate ligase